MADVKLATTGERNAALMRAQVASPPNNQLLPRRIEQNAKVGEPNKNPNCANDQARKRAKQG